MSFSPPGLLNTSTTAVRPPALIENGVSVIGVGASLSAGASSAAYVTVYMPLASGLNVKTVRSTVTVLSELKR